MLEERKQHIFDAGDWQFALRACPNTAGVQLERARLEAGEPWCVTRLAGLQFYRYDRPSLDDTPLRPGSGERLNLVRRPDNPADCNAVEAWLRNEHMLGHVPRDLAAEIAPDLDRGIGLRAYALCPGTGTAWSVRALLVGVAVRMTHDARLRAHARRADWASRTDLVPWHASEPGI